MRVFLTGGSGFVGRALIRQLLANGDEVIALSRTEASDANIMQAVSVHISDFTCIGPWEAFLEATVAGTRNVVKAAQAAGVPRLVHISTEAVLVRDGGLPAALDERTPYNLPRWYAPYTRSKALAEQEVLAANKQGQLATVVVRPRFIWGVDDTVLMPAICNPALRWPRPDFLTSTCNVANVVEGTLLAAEKGQPGEVYFLSDGPPVQWRSWLTQLIQTQGLKPPTATIPIWLAWIIAIILENLPFLDYSTRPAAPSDMRLTRQMLSLTGMQAVVDDSKARKELGYKAHLSREEGLAQLRAEAAEKRTQSEN
eukprot:jgi/Astpho2/8805/fgenesh1_pg.00129_%23_7_t